MTSTESTSFFNLLDYFYITIMFISTLFGFANGFARTLFSSMAWIGSGFASAFLTKYVCAFLDNYFEQKIVIQLLGSSIAYVLCLTVFLAASYMATDAVKQSKFLGIDRALGLLFGLIRGMIIPVGVVAVFAFFSIPLSKFETMSESKISVLLYGYINEIVLLMDKTPDKTDGSLLKKYKKQINDYANQKAIEAEKALQLKINKPKHNGLGTKIKTHNQNEHDKQQHKNKK